MENLLVLVMMLLLGKFSDGADDMSELSIVPESADSEEAGSDFVMSCLYAPEVVSDIRWIGPDGTEIFNSAEKIIESEEGMLLLTLKMISTDDEGIYTCEGLSSAANTTIDVKRTVAVFDPVAIVNTPAVQEFEIGHSVSVTCNVEGSPTPDVFWLEGTDKIELLDGGKYSMQPGTTNLVIQDISKEDEGTYTCKARQLSKGKVKEISIEVKVIIPPEIRNFDPDIIVIEGNAAKLACDAYGEPEPTYSWYRGDGSVTDQTTLVAEGSMLALSNVTKDMDGEQYTCIAGNKVAADEATLTLTVYIKPSFTVAENYTTKVQESARLRCVAEGDPAPSVSFYRYGVRMEENYVPATTESEEEFSVTPNYDYMPDTTEKAGNSSDVAGQWSPSPPPSVTYNGQEAVLQFESVYKSDAGVYECRANSAAGLATAEVILTVQYGPEDAALRDVFACNDQVASLECQIDANPAPELSWGLLEVPEGSNDLESGQFVPFNASNPPEGITIVRIGDILQLNVETSAVADAFKLYYCKAENVIDYTVASAEIMRAPTPDAPQEVAVTDIGTREATISIVPPLVSLVPIKTYVIAMVPTANDVEMRKQTIHGSMRNYTFDELEHDTEYTVSVSVENCADTGPPNIGTKFRTEAIEDPDPVDIISGKASEDHDKYTVEWNVNSGGGGEISKITIMLHKVVKDVDANKTESIPFGEEVVIKPGDDSYVEGSYVFEGLDPGSDYEISVNVYNEVGSAKSKKMFTTATNQGSKPEVATGSIDASIIGIIVAVLLLLLIIIDVTCCFTRSCGCTMWIYSHTCGKSKKHKIQDPEEGSAEFRQDQEGKYSVTEQS